MKASFNQVIRYSVLASAISLVTACGSSNSSNNSSATNGSTTTGSTTSSNTEILGTQAFINGDIYTVNPAQPWAEALVIKDDEILFVGTTTDAQAHIGNSTQTTDLQGQMMLPGFQDAHLHAIENFGFNFDLSRDADIDELQNQVAQADKNISGSGWLIGYNHSLEVLLASDITPITLLDEVVNDRPVIIMDATSHSMWVNSVALEQVGFDNTSPDPEGGFLVRDQNGELTGILVDNAGNMAMDIALEQMSVPQEERYDLLVNEVLPLFVENGITSATDARTFWQREDHITWQTAAENGDLPVRITASLWAYPELDDEMQLAKLKSLYLDTPNQLLRINTIKFYSDGIFSNQTAATHEAYGYDQWGGQAALADNIGLNYFTQQRLETYIRELEPTGFDFMIHAVGDRGIHESLNAIQNASQGAGRHKLTHVHDLDPDDLDRFAALNVIADVQVGEDISETEGEALTTDANHSTEEEEHTPIPLRSLQDSGARITLSSDWTVTPLNPFFGIQNAMQQTPEQLTLDEAIRAYTINPAYSMRQEDSTGTLEVGKKADLVILNKNLFEIPTNIINQTRIELTMVNGKTVYQRSN